MTGFPQPDAGELIASVMAQLVEWLQAYVEEPAERPGSFPLAGLDDAGLSKLAALLESTDGGKPP